MTVLEKGNITIHTENIFPIIKKSLYTDHEIFLRELISNSVDAISKLKMASLAGEARGEVPEPEINLAIDKENRTLSITDNGIGMTGEEIKKYINQVAFSSAEEFITKYQKSAKDLIGHFGLGFYSAFMVAKKVEIDTLSYQEGATPVHWCCDGSPEFELTDSSRSQIGTTITLTLMDEEGEYLEPARIRQLVKTYSDFMPVPIKIDGEVINQQRALWKESSQNLTKEDYLEFYRYLYPFQEEPLLWVHLNTDYPFLLNGILYFPKLRPDVDVSKGQLKLFCNQVFVSDHCEEIIPDFLIPLRGVIDSPDIPLNVSRSALTKDRTVRRIADFIAKKIADRLKSLYNEDAKEYIRCWGDVGTFIKFGSLKEDKFKQQVEDILIYRTTYKPPETPVQVQVQTAEGDAWQEATAKTPLEAIEQEGYTTLKAYLERHKERHENRVFYCTDPRSQSTYVELYKNQGLEILFFDSFIDTNYFIPFLEREYSDVKFTRVDSELDSTLLEQDQASEIIDPGSNKTRAELIKEIFAKALDNSRINIKTEALKSDDPQGTPPAIVLLPEAMRRLQEMTAMMQQKAMAFPEEHILMINTNHPLIQQIVQISQGSIVTGSGESPSAQLAKMLCQHVYDLALIAQKGFDAEGMQAFVERSNRVLTKLTEKI
ncbi:MAG: molecular chaperone HtpG [Microcystis viridis Mv_BB_P_19951000_S69]|uniref:Molecular chaperone HtpG n=1 Tax=Microcystis viridis Mv_BB_P_19951000_S68D TaxID=2486270 RepID=A0A552HF65_MICVR|nr:molecular chaperone HtpG [Microcystis aeruginosa]TRU69865.1 MAG: molecular chaperone HtpG [Microcystis viridis Mv_BB_P_19951000_S68D]TRU76876.1 MAG: molecular chaperone HtpG [Microcystis viridis Mv_BB_P_19951000_S69]TRU78759.1 MAG: molecular chaperone HtpG [Microcystis viridis Mv_BB_P_19951000_S68]TRU85062.1 MAG: molecular chaperone HtpG [Microcystis viridis Mv_BB_P_19951000_S69D]MDB9421600.1 molecular chaperone HtpG [Microcystis aeruginosa CS-563/04]